MPAYAQHLQDLRQGAPDLARHLLTAWMGALRQPDLHGLAGERQRAQQWVLQLDAERSAWQQRLEAAMRAGIDERALPRPAASPGGLLKLSDLTLVDEDAAERDIEISRLVQGAETRCEGSWRELMLLVAALHAAQGDRGRFDAQQHPGALGVWARAVGKALHEAGLQGAQRSVLMRLSAEPLGEALDALYQDMAARLEAAGVQPAGLRVHNLAGTGAPALRLQGEAPDAARTGRPAPGPLAASAGAGAGSGGGGGGSDGGGGGGGGGAISAAELERVLGASLGALRGDARLGPALGETWRRLEDVVLRLAEADPSLLVQEHHPTWALLDLLARHASELPPGTTARATDFAAFVQPVVERLTQAARPDRAAFAEALTDVQGFVAQEEAQQFAASAPVRLELDQSDRIQTLRPMLLQQVREQLSARHLLVTPRLAAFLEGPWIEAMARAIAQQGAEGELARALVNVVDPLLATMVRPRDDAERQRMVRSVPPIIRTLQQGMDLLQLPAAERQAVLDELMQSHQRLLFVPAVTMPAPMPSEPVAAPPSVADTLPDWTPSDLVEQAADRWSASQPADTNIGMLPTVPMQLESAHDTNAVQDWLDGLRSGQRCKLFVQGQWATTKLSWRSENGQFFLFQSNLPGGAHSLTRRALARLRAEGLATELSAPSPLRALLGRTAP